MFRQFAQISLVLSLITSYTFNTNASILSKENGSQSIEGVKVSKTANLEVQNQKIGMDLVGAGLRGKKVLFTQVKVYVAELFSSDASQFIRTKKEALTSFDKSRTTAIRLTFLRSVDAETVQTSFRDALDANAIDTESKQMSTFLNAVNNGGEAVNGQSMIIATQKNADKTETVYYEDTQGHLNTVQGPQGFAKEIMAIWLGEAADPGISELQNQILLRP